MRLIVCLNCPPEHYGNLFKVTDITSFEENLTNRVCDYISLYSLSLIHISSSQWREVVIATIPNTTQWYPSSKVRSLYWVNLNFFSFVNLCDINIVKKLICTSTICHISLFECIFERYLKFSPI